MKSSGQTISLPPTLAKCPSGIRGLDEITGGGLPRGRPTLVCGSSGSGKTLLAMQFLVKGVEEFGEPGVFMSFEESEEDLAKNVSSLGFNLPALVAAKKLVIDRVVLDHHEMIETGEYDLDGLFIRLGAAIDAIGAKRVVLDTLEVLFIALGNQAILRSELHRLFDWLKEKQVTALVTAEQGSGTLTTRGMEEYVSDCVIVLSQTVADEIATRRMRVVKYRGSAHGGNEYPFVIDAQGVALAPVTNIMLDYPASRETISTGLPKLDAMLGGDGYFRGGTLLISGNAGTGKSSFAAHFADAACRRGERAAYFAFEESPDQIIRNMRSIGIDLGAWVAGGLLRFASSRPMTFGLEVQLKLMINLVDTFKPRIVVLDPVSSLIAAGTLRDASAMLLRMVDLLKERQVTAMFTSLTSGGQSAEETEVGVSSLCDSWLALNNLERAGERIRTLTIVKSRGRKHSNQTRELLLTDHGADLADIFVGPDGAIVSGSARATQQAQDRAAAAALQREIERKKSELERQRRFVEARIAEMQAELSATTEEVEAVIAEKAATAETLLSVRLDWARARDGRTFASNPLDNGRK